MASRYRRGGFEIRKGWLSRQAQAAMAADIRGVAEAAPFFAPLTPGASR